MTNTVQMGDATTEQLDELRTLFQTRQHSPMWRATNFAYIEAKKAKGEQVSAVFAETLARWLREQPDMPEPQPATGRQYDQIRYALDNRHVPEPFASWVAGRVDGRKLTRALADLTLTDLEKMPRKPRRGHRVPAGIPAGEVPDGYYALGTDQTGIRFYSLRTKNGRQIVRALRFEKDGRTADRRPILPTGTARRVVEAIAADVNAAQRLYGTAGHHCTQCNQPIGDPDGNPGFDHGYGPDCWRKLQRQTAPAATLSTDLEDTNV